MKRRPEILLRSYQRNARGANKKNGLEKCERFFRRFSRGDLRVSAQRRPVAGDYFWLCVFTFRLQHVCLW